MNDTHSDNWPALHYLLIKPIRGLIQITHSRKQICRRTFLKVHRALGDIYYIPEFNTIKTQLGTPRDDEEDTLSIQNCKNLGGVD